MNYLGVSINKKLNCSLHHRNIEKKLAFASNVIYEIRNILNVNIIKSFTIVLHANISHVK